MCHMRTGIDWIRYLRAAQHSWCGVIASSPPGGGLPSITCGGRGRNSGQMSSNVRDGAPFAGTIPMPLLLHGHGLLQNRREDNSFAYSFYRTSLPCTSIAPLVFPRHRIRELRLARLSNCRLLSRCLPHRVLLYLCGGVECIQYCFSSSRVCDLNFDIN